MPDEVSRRLFEALRLQIRYDFTTHIATCTITLTGDTIDAVARTSQETIADGPAEHATGHHQAVGGRAALSPHGMVCVRPQRGSTQTITSTTYGFPGGSAGDRRQST